MGERLESKDSEECPSLFRLNAWVLPKFVSTLQQAKDTLSRSFHVLESVLISIETWIEIKLAGSHYHFSSLQYQVATKPHNQSALAQLHQACLLSSIHRPF